MYSTISSCDGSPGTGLAMKSSFVGNRTSLSGGSGAIAASARAVRSAFDGRPRLRRCWFNDHSGYIRFTADQMHFIAPQERLECIAAKLVASQLDDIA